MNPLEAKQEFERYLARRGLHLTHLTPAAGFDAMVGFYNDVRAEGCDSELSQDMLLYQWGTYDWGQGPHFEFDVVRQLILPRAEDEDIWQLGVTFRFTPTNALVALGSGYRWCQSPHRTEALEKFVLAHAVIDEVGARKDATVELRYACAA